MITHWQRRLRSTALWWRATYNLPATKTGKRPSELRIWRLRWVLHKESANYLLLDSFDTLSFPPPQGWGLHLHAGIYVNLSLCHSGKDSGRHLHAVPHTNKFWMILKMIDNPPWRIWAKGGTLWLPCCCLGQIAPSIACPAIRSLFLAKKSWPPSFSFAELTKSSTKFGKMMMAPEVNFCPNLMLQPPCEV